EEAAGREQHAVRPQRARAVAGRAREPLALRDEPRADARAARRRLDQQQAQLRHGRAALDDEHAPDALPVLLRDPAALACRIVTLDELRDDGGDQPLEALVPAEFLRVERAVTLHDPAHLARPEAPQREWRGALGPPQPPLARRHRLDMAPPHP